MIFNAVHQFSADRVRIVYHICMLAFPLFKATEQAVADPGTSEQGGAVPTW